jgi:hypothetical protein
MQMLRPEAEFPGWPLVVYSTQRLLKRRNVVNAVRRQKAGLKHY